MTFWTLPTDPAHVKLTLTIVSSFYALWIFLFFVGSYHHPIPSGVEKKMKPYDKLIFRFRVVNCYHGASAVLMSLYWYFTDFNLQYGRRNSVLELCMLSNTMAYLTLDGIFMKWENFLDFGNLMHHCIGIAVYSQFAYSGFDYSIMAYHLLPGEISNVAMHLREIIKRCGLRYSKIYYLNDYSYYIEYLCCRTIWIPTTYYWLFNAPTVSPIAKLIFPLHVVQSWYYCTQIPPLMIQRWKEFQKIQKLKVPIGWFTAADPEELKKHGIVSYERYHM